MNAIKAEQIYGAKALEFCRAQQALQKGKAALTTIRPGMEEWRAWEKYFNDFLGFEPVMMRMVRSEKFAAMTVPSQWPEWFDAEYARQQADDSAISRAVARPQEPSAAPYVSRNRANVYVPADNALFPQMVDRARNADASDYRYDQERGGIWVVRGWVDSDDTAKRATKRFTADDLRRIYARHDEAQVA